MFDRDGGRLVWRGDGETLVVEPWGRDSVRVRAALGDVVDADWALLPPDPAAHAGVVIEVDGPTATLTNGRLRVVARATTGRDWQTGAVAHDCRLELRDT